MPFTREKFLSLAPRNRAKKLADLLKEVLAAPENNSVSRDSLDEYHRLIAWHDAPEKKVKREERALMENYIHWRREAGMGPEEAVLRELRVEDRAEPAVEAMPWQVLLHDLRSGHNVGSIIRTADCFGLSGIRLSGYTPGPEADSVRAAAMGAESWVNIARDANMEVALEHARKEGLVIVALEISDEAKELGDYEWPERGLLVLGNEELGIAPEILAAMDHVVSIPMYGRKASMNVANAFALAAWEMRRTIHAR